MVLKIGTRGSKLALWQAEHIAALLRPSGIQTQIEIIETKGDKILDVTIGKIGSKGVFTEEIEAKLLDGSIDIAVHSAKDLSSELPDELELIAFTERELVNDVLISNKPDFDLHQVNITVGTASTRRIAFLKHFYPNVIAVTVRGNLQTRIQKMHDGACDALMLAYAGVHRMGFNHLIKETIGTSYFVPAVGQGTIAVQCHKKLDFRKKEAIQQYVNHAPTEDCLRAERAFLKTLQGGCSIPSFGYAHYEGDLITLKAGIISLDGRRVVKVKESANPADAKELGKKVAMEVLAEGGKEILNSIRQIQQPK
jgi:hydroxymethylbilane synthase